MKKKEEEEQKKAQKERLSEVWSRKDHEKLPKGRLTCAAIEGCYNLLDIATFRPVRHEPSAVSDIGHAGLDLFQVL